MARSPLVRSEAEKKSAKRCAGQKGFAAHSAFPIDQGAKVEVAVGRFHHARPKTISLQPRRSYAPRARRPDDSSSLGSPQESGIAFPMSLVFRCFLDRGPRVGGEHAVRRQLAIPLPAQERGLRCRAELAVDVQFGGRGERPIERAL